jgi:hypothetical protein
MLLSNFLVPFMFHFIEQARRQKKGNILLMCKQHLVAYYQGMGFLHMGLSKSTHGGAEWHEMRLKLGSQGHKTDAAL